MSHSDLGRTALRPVAASAIALGCLTMTAGAVSACTTPVTPPVHTVSAGDNAGDVWVSNVGDPSTAGHENDPHLSCANIAVWGSGLYARSGSITIDGWAPTGSGHGSHEYTLSWSTTGTAAHVVGTIPVQTLIADARSDGDTPQPQQGYHFQLEFGQNPQKHKTFWVDCGTTPTPTPTPRPTPSCTPKPRPTPHPSATPTPSPSSSPTPAPTSTPTPDPSTPTPAPSTPTPSPTPGGGVLGTSSTPTPSPSTPTPTPSSSQASPTPSPSGGVPQGGSPNGDDPTVVTQLSNSVPTPVTGAGAAVLAGAALCLAGFVTLLLTRTRRRPV